METLLRWIRALLSKEQRRFVKFCLVGTSGVPVNLLCTFLGFRYLFFSLDDTHRTGAAYLLGIAVSIFTNFLLNDIWTWRDREKATRGILGRMMRFYLVCSLASGIQFGTAMGLAVGLDLHYLLAQVVGIALATGVNFLVNNVWTFRAPPPAEDAQEPNPEDDTSGGPGSQGGTPP